MINKNHLKAVLTAAVITLFFSCDAEKDYVTNASSIKAGNSEISFSEFKSETKLFDFPSEFKIPHKKSGASSRNADGTYELSDFDIDIETIKRLELDDNITYTFRIYPKTIISSESFYNLTLDKVDGVWVHNVLELTPTLENFDNLMSGTTNDINGKMSLLFTSDPERVNMYTTCYSIGIVGNNCKLLKLQNLAVVKNTLHFVLARTIR
ncbi:MAG: hypothetical protein ACO1N9_07885 [Flavobacterium sp.]